MKAANQDITEAQYNRVIYYEEGKGVEQSFKAVYWYKSCNARK